MRECDSRPHQDPTSRLHRAESHGGWADNSLYAVESSRPRGDALIERRVEAIESLVQEYLSTPAARVQVSLERAIAVGLGSSLGHARYINFLLTQYTNVACGVACPVDFMPDMGGQAGPGTALLFSQGLSENTHPTIEKMIADRRGVIFTAVAPNDSSSSAAKRAVVERARAAGIDVVPFPLVSEYQTLVRVVGPFVGYIAAHRFVASLPEARLAPLEMADIKDLFPAARSAASILGRHITLDDHRQLKVVTLPPTNNFAHNLGEKIKEGLYLPRPELIDIFEFDHGAFQNACRNGSPVIVLSHEGAGEAVGQAISRLCEGASRGRLPTPCVLNAPESLRPELRILFYEMAFNFFLAEALKQSTIDQVNWPGKGLDMNYVVSGCKRAE